MLPLTKAAQGSVHTVKWAFGLPEIMEKLETLKIHQGSRILVVQKDKDSKKDVIFIFILLLSL